MIPIIQKMLAPLQRRVALMVSRAVVTLVDDSLKMQCVQVSLLAGVTRDGVEHFQQYGLTSHSFAGAEGVMVSVGGNQDHGIVIAVDDRRYRLVGLAEGEVALYDDLGQKVHLTRGGIVVDGAGKPVTVQNTPHVDFNTPTVNMSGNLSVAGNIVAQGDVSDRGTKSMAGMRAVFNGHPHNENNVLGGPTTAPTQQM